MRLAFLGLGCLFACSAATTSESSDHDLTVHPTGGSTEIEVVAVPNSKTESITVDRDGSAQLLLQDSTPAALSAGNAEVAVVTAGGAVATTHTLTLTEGTRTTLKLGGLRFGRSTNDLIAGFDLPGTVYGKDPITAELRTGLGQIQSVAPNEDAWVSLGTRVVKARAGEGAITDVAIDDPTGLRAIRIVPPAVREFPDVGDMTIELTYGASTWRTWQSGLGTKPILFISPQASTLFVVTGGTTSTGLLDMPLVDASHPLTTLQYQRLDVASVVVTLPDGSKKTVPGRFGAKSGAISVSGPTDHGVDVPPGIYDVVVDYAHPSDGHAMRYTATVDLH